MKQNARVAPGVSNLPVTVNPRPDAPGTVQHVGLGDVLRRFRDPKPEVRELIRRIRATEDKAARNALKKQLPVVIFSGRFAYRNEQGIQEYSGLACIDLDAQDNPGKDLVALKDLLARDGYVLAVFTSAGGRGLKLLVRLSEPVDPAADVEALRKAHRAGFEAFRSYLRDVYGLVADTTPDLSRGCYVTWDPDLRVDPEARTFSFRHVPERAPAVRPSGDGAVDLELVESALEAIPMGPSFPYHDWLRIGLALAGTLGVREAVRLMLTYGGGHPGDTPEYLERTFRSARGEIGLGTVFWYAQQYGWRPPRKQRAAGKQTARPEQEIDDSEELLLWRPFPVDLLPGPVADYVRAGARAVPCDASMLAAPVLAVLSAAVGSGVRVRLKRSWLESAAFWCVVATPSGTAKSAALALALRPIYELEAEADARYRAERQAYEQKLKEWKALDREDRARVPEPEPPRAVRYRLSDATLEAVAAVHRENPRGLLLARDELSGWFASFDRYTQTRGGDLASWLELYEGRPVVVDRKTAPEPVRIERPHVPVAGTVQPWILRERVSPELLASGFVARLTIVMPPEVPRRFTDADVSEEVEAAYARLVRQLYQVGDVELSLSIEARRLFGAFVEELDGARRKLPDGPLRAASAKIEAKAARLALLFQLAEDVQAGRQPSEVSAETMRRAIELARWLWHETQRVYALMRWSGLNYAALHKSAAERLFEKMPGEFSTADWLQAAEAQGIPRRTAERWLSQLASAGRIERLQKGAYRKTATVADGGNGGNGGTVLEDSATSATSAIRQVAERTRDRFAPTTEAPAELRQQVLELAEQQGWPAVCVEGLRLEPSARAWRKAAQVWTARGLQQALELLTSIRESGAPAANKP